jgi:peptide deformylase
LVLEVVTIEKTPKAEKILKRPAKTLSFPLSSKIYALIEEMKVKVVELNGVGLAASQVGHHLRLIVYRIPAQAVLSREDANEIIPLTVLVNPTYTPVPEDGLFSDWEGCFSVTELMGKVSRHKTILYEAMTPEGKYIKEIAHGFLARVLQHEIDHTDGILITERLTAECIQGKPPELTAIRKKDLENIASKKTTST